MLAGEAPKQSENLNGRLVAAMRDDEAATNVLRAVGGDEVQFVRLRNVPVISVSKAMNFWKPGASTTDKTTATQTVMFYLDAFKKVGYIEESDKQIARAAAEKLNGGIYQGMPPKSFLSRRCFLLLGLYSRTPRGLLLREQLKLDPDMPFADVLAVAGLRQRKPHGVVYSEVTHEESEVRTSNVVSFQTAPSLHPQPAPHQTFWRETGKVVSIADNLSQRQEAINHLHLEAEQAAERIASLEAEIEELKERKALTSEEVKRLENEIALFQMMLEALAAKA